MRHARLGTLLSAVWLVSSAQAAVLCERKGKVKIRATACKGAEQVLVDLGAVGTDSAAQTAGIASVDAKAKLIARELAVSCPGAPERKLADNGLSGYHDKPDCGGGCRLHDGDQAACDLAFAQSDDGATSCFFFKGLCLPCADCGDRRSSACTNACAVPGSGTCAGDPTRTTSIGGPGTEACQRLRTQESCEAAFEVGRAGPASCWWDAGDDDCQGCGPGNENRQRCTNTCQTPRTCADASRATFRQCNGLDQMECDDTWHIDVKSGGRASSCFFDAADNQCRGCGVIRESAGDCTNTCQAGS